MTMDFVEGKLNCYTVIKNNPKISHYRGNKTVSYAGFTSDFHYTEIK